MRHLRDRADSAAARSDASGLYREPQGRRRLDAGNLRAGAAGVAAGLLFAALTYGLASLTGCGTTRAVADPRRGEPPATTAPTAAVLPDVATTPAPARAPARAPAPPPGAASRPVATAPVAVTAQTRPSGVPALAATAPAPVDDLAGADPVLRRGSAVYAKHCAVCHGPGGLGDGLASFLLYPKPRNFSQGQFRLTSVTSGLPTDDDILRTLQRGMPGSAMPPWAHLPKEDLDALVAVVRDLAVQGKAAGMMERNKSLNREKALKNARAVLQSGGPIEIPPEPPADGIDVALGKATYAQSCAACHGEDGTGNSKSDFKDASGFPTYARDFTKGVFKGSPEATDLARRIVGGMPGSPMPASTLAPKELWSLVQYVRTLVKPGAQERVAQRQMTLTARRLRAEEALPLGADGAAWTQAAPVFVPLMPLWWKDVRVEGVSVQAVHDGRTVAVRLTWRDPGNNELPTMSEAFTDGAALQLSAEADPPFFGMGGGVANGGIVNIWHWKAAWQRDLRDQSASLNAMNHTYPNAPAIDDFGQPREDAYFTARAADNPLARPARQSVVEALAAKGMGTLTTAMASAQKVKGQGRWKDGEWAVVFVRTLRAEQDGEVPLDGRDGVSVAFAVWDGAAGDRDGQKSVSIWHRLSLER